MGCCFSTKQCYKCGCPSDYYNDMEKGASCQIHSFIGEKCIDCGIQSFSGNYGNCVHKWA
jgi:hypothetical protein